MSLLFKNFRVHQIFGANTDVGKTLLTTALIRASASRQNKVFYLKPVSTGPLSEADDLHVKRYSGQHKESVNTECLFQYRQPISPHLAAKNAVSDDNTVQIPSDETLVNSIASRIRHHAALNSQTPAHMYIETAGGVLSPCLSGTSQSDCYRPLFLPTILIGDSKLGGISSTISSYESLSIRGYSIDAILLFRDEYYKNWEFLSQYFSERGIEVFAVNSPPNKLSNPSENYISTSRYYESITSPNPQNGLFPVIDHLDNCHSRRLVELDSMAKRTLDTVWWPFVQHKSFKKKEDVTVIDSAYADFFSVYKGKNSSEQSTGSLLAPEFDGSASWWTQTFGHSNPALTLAAARASGRYGHVIFPLATHLPALKLAERLVHDGPGKGWASRAFFSDNGSTGMEVAIKMALRDFVVRGGKPVDESAKKNLGILGLKGSYHGDTIGAMDACEEGVYTCEWHNAKGYWFEPPSIGYRNGEILISIPPGISGTSATDSLRIDSLAEAYNVEKRLNSPLAHSYATYINDTLDSIERQGDLKLAALVLEPLAMGAGGMIFVDPVFQRVLIDIVRTREFHPGKRGLPVIFDEVFVGLHRIGMESTGPLLGTYPDISVNAKILTGGLIPLAVTMTSEAIFQAFLSDSKADSLLHGHSYTAHPIGCEVANETLNLLKTVTTSQDWKDGQEKWSAEHGNERSVWSLWDPDFVIALSKAPNVEEVMTLGSVLSMKIKDNEGGYTSSSAQTTFQSLRNFNDNSSQMSSAPGGASFAVHFRTLGNVAYFMTSLNTSSSVIRNMEDKIWNCL